MISVVVVTFNSADDVRNALSGIISDDVEVIVVDNCSSDSTTDIVAKEFPTVRVIQTGANLGFARAVNIGVGAARSDCILLLNPDAVVSMRTIQRAVTMFATDAEVGVIGPDVIEGHGQLTTMAAGYEPTVLRMFTHSTGLSRLASRWPALRGHYLLRGHVAPDSQVDVAWVSGGCLFSRMDVWRAIDGLTERWFMYAEDVDYCLRARDSGWRVVFSSSLSATHIVGASSSNGGAIRTVWLENLFDLYKSYYHAGIVRQLLWRCVVGTGYAARSMVAIIGMPSTGRSRGLVDAARFAAYARVVFSRRLNNAG